MPRELLHSQEWFCYAGLDRGAYYLRWKGWWEFLISAEGNRIIGRPIGKGSLESFYNYLLTQVLSFALLRQGIESLHCTAMLVGGRAVGFLGDSGYGKSSLAAAFVRSGYPLITDDVLVLQKHGNGFLAYPGLPRVKLFPERAEKLLGRPVKGTRMNPSTAKMVIPLLPEETCRTAVPLRSLYVLNSPATARQSKKVTIKRLSRREAFVALIQNNFNSRMNVPDRLRGHFFFSSAVAAKTPVSIMSYPRTWTSLAKVCEAVQRDLAR
ncbi:MAG: hypothetical protein HY046_05235 [Acidobacteria bacterium]|nr:hypothetical protein [Acidobacteriota bacterium]